MSIRVLQLSDLHLHQDRASTLRGVPTWQSFEQVLQFIAESDDEFDFVVITGDLAHDEQRETYESLRKTLTDYTDRLRLLPGNHDDRPLLRQIFAELFTEPIDSLVFSTRLGGWRLIGLDSQCPGEVAGRVGDTQLEWLDRQLASSNEPTIVFVHHPPFSVDSDWLDRIGICPAESLMQLLTREDSYVRAVCSGHVHHEFHRQISRLKCYTTPSTGVQFAPSSDEPTYDLIAPGFRVFTLDEDDFQTKVVRLPKVTFPPDPMDR